MSAFQRNRARGEGEMRDRCLSADMEGPHRRHSPLLAPFFLVNYSLRNHLNITNMSHNPLNPSVLHNKSVVQQFCYRQALRCMSLPRFSLRLARPRRKRVGTGNQCGKALGSVVESRRRGSPQQKQRTPSIPKIVATFFGYIVCPYSLSRYIPSVGKGFFCCCARNSLRNASIAQHPCYWIRGQLGSAVPKISLASPALPSRA
jgi:hypothetical protein